MTENDPLRFTQRVLRSADVPATEPVLATDAVLPVRGHEPADGRPRRRAPESAPPDFAGGHFAELTRAVEEAHQRLVAAGSRYRFCIYRRGPELFIDVVVLGDDGKIASVREKNITHDEFAQWVENIAKGEGMFFDHCG